MNNFRVDSAQYCDDIKHWRHRNMQHKECPVFVKYNESQPVKNEGEGHMFYLYEEEEEEGASEGGGDEEEASEEEEEDEEYE